MLVRIVISALVAISLAVPAQAQHSTETVTVIVDKSTRASKAQLTRRIAAAVEEVCGSYATAFSWQEPEIDKCRDKAWSSANRQLAAIRGEGRIALSSR